MLAQVPGPARTTALLLAAGILLGGCSSSGPGDGAADAAVLEPGLVAQQGSALDLGAAPDTGQPSPGVLMTPHSAQRITSVEVGPELAEGAASLLGLSRSAAGVAPDGHDVVVVTLSARDLAPPFDPDPDAGAVVTTELVVGDTRTAITPFTGYLGTIGPTTPSVWTQPDTTLAVVAPVDTPVLYSVTDEGRTASIDLRTGERSTDEGTTAGDLYYTDRFAPVAGEASSTGDVRLGDGTLVAPSAQLTLSLTDRSVVASPWLPGRGWAAAGRTWLSVNTDVGLTAGGFSTFIRVSVDPSTSFTLTGPDGVAVPAQPGTSAVTPGLTPVAGGSLGAVWDVPAGLTGGTIDVDVDPVLSYQEAPWAFDGPALQIPGVAFAFDA